MHIAIFLVVIFVSAEVWSLPSPPESVMESESPSDSVAESGSPQRSGRVRRFTCNNGFTGDFLCVSVLSFRCSKGAVATMALASATSDAMAADAYSVSTLDPAATQASYVAPARVR